MKIDMHVHSEYSYDGAAPVKEIFEWADKRGLDGVAITDHFDNRAWNEAKEVAEEKDMFFIEAEEIRVLNEKGKTRAEVLAYFLEEPLGNKTIKEIRKEVDKQDAMIFLSHPYARTRPSPAQVKGILKYVDGIEAFNARSRLRKTNRKAKKLAEDHNMPVVGGSDAHIPMEVGYGYTEVEGADTLEEFRRGLKKGRASTKGKLTNFIVHYLSQLKGRV